MVNSCPQIFPFVRCFSRSICCIFPKLAEKPGDPFDPFAQVDISMLPRVRISARNSEDVRASLLLCHWSI